MNEFGIIAKYFSPLSAGFPGAFGLKDDAAILSPKAGFDLIFTKDAMVAGVHFFKQDNPYTIAQKLLGVNVSDLEAMGAKPVGYLLAIMLPKNTDEKWLAEFTRGFKDGMAKFGGQLIGGDTVSHDGELVLSLTAIGEVPQGKALKRSGAKVGDAVFVSGTIGDSYLGLQILKENIAGISEQEKQYLVERYNIPNPRIELGSKLIGIATSCIDISDGLVADLGHICECSNVGAEINIENVPLSPAAKNLSPKLTDLVTGGDDYELLFTAPEALEETIENLSQELNLPITKIGKITSGERVVVLDKNGGEAGVISTGYKHF